MSASFGGLQAPKRRSSFIRQQQQQHHHASFNNLILRHQAPSGYPKNVRKLLSTSLSSTNISLWRFVHPPPPIFLHLPLSNFQKIKTEEDFSFILSIIPNVTIILRHIWTMSNYYSKDRNMLNLLGQISYVFAEKVKILINVDTIFK